MCPTAATRCPAFAKPKAIARPKPRNPPVTIATRCSITFPSFTTHPDLSIHHRGTEDTEKKLQNEPANSVLQERRVEIDDQPHLVPAQPEVREDLSLMNGQQLLYSFDLQDQRVMTTTSNR